MRIRLATCFHCPFDGLMGERIGARHTSHARAIVRRLFADLTGYRLSEFAAA
jgi:hypothetical protein